MTLLNLQIKTMQIGQMGNSFVNPPQMQRLLLQYQRRQCCISLDHIPSSDQMILGGSQQEYPHYAMDRHTVFTVAH